MTTAITAELRVVARHRVRGTGYVSVRTGPATSELSQVTTVAGSTYIVRTESIVYVPPDMAKLEKNLEALWALT